MCVSPLESAIKSSPSRSNFICSTCAGAVVVLFCFALYHSFPLLLFFLNSHFRLFKNFSLLSRRGLSQRALLTWLRRQHRISACLIQPSLGKSANHRSGAKWLLLELVSTMLTQARMPTTKMRCLQHHDDDLRATTRDKYYIYYIYGTGFFIAFCTATFAVHIDHVSLKSASTLSTSTMPGFPVRRDGRVFACAATALVVSLFHTLLSTSAQAQAHAATVSPYPQGPDPQPPKTRISPEKPVAGNQHALGGPITAENKPI